MEKKEVDVAKGFNFYHKHQQPWIQQQLTTIISEK